MYFCGPLPPRLPIRHSIQTITFTGRVFIAFYQHLLLLSVKLWYRIHNFCDVQLRLGFAPGRVTHSLQAKFTTATGMEGTLPPIWQTALERL
jgi:hypothetical protein